MTETTPVPTRRQPGQPGVQASDVRHAADELLRDGIWPSNEQIRARLGRGSPNTINQHRQTWWKSLGARLDSGPAALHRLPERVLHAAESLWVIAQEEAVRQTNAEQSSAQGALTRARTESEIRSYALSLREREIEKQLQERTRSLDAVQAQLVSLSQLFGKAAASKESADRQIAHLEKELNDLRDKFALVLAKAVAAGRRRSAPSRQRRPVPRPAVRKRPPAPRKASTTTPRKKGRKKKPVGKRKSR